jgi:AcrR family transcriptional regulator
MVPSRRNGSATREQLLKAARTVLQRDGVAALSTRSVGAEASVNLSLIHYHFGSRDGLLLAVLEQMDAELLARQRGMYARPGETLAEKWRQAIAFYHQDLESGYVRALLELAAHGYSHSAMAERVRAMFDGWRRLINEVVADALPRLGLSDVDPEQVTTAIACYWQGMELQHLLGTPEEEGRLWQTVESIGRLIERLEQAGAPASLDASERPEQDGSRTEV